ncbi:MAG: 50S ribosomal protein L29 [candidate division Zixibacteria bacterium]|nr:50S ribosomal protein L29 [candidate division Zixibacteria bacterium]
MKAEIIRDLTQEEVLQRQAELEEELFNLRLKKRTKELDNPLRIRMLRRDLARINSILREAELGIRQLARSTKILADEKE